MTTEEQINLYCEQKENVNILNKSIAKLNTAIKKTLIDSGLKRAETDDYEVTLETRVTEDVDQIKMLGILKECWKNIGDTENCPFIRTVETVDMDELEKYMYKGLIPKDTVLALDACRVKKETKALTYKAKKGE